MLKGLINQDANEMRRLFPKCSEELMAQVLESRAITWQLLCRVSEFSDEDLNTPIEEAELQDLDSPVLRTVLYIRAMESPIRYVLQEATLHKQ